MSLITNLAIDNLNITQKRALIEELKNAIKFDKSVARSARMLARAEKAQARADKRNERIAKLEEKLAALKNPVGYKAIKSNKRPSKAVVTKVA